MEIIIDPEFQNLIPPQSLEERQQLEENIKADGVREPLVVWVLPEWKPEGAVEPLAFKDFAWRRYQDHSIRCWQYVTQRGEALEVTEDDWPAILIDGHHRHQIASRLDLQTHETEKFFATRGEAIEWMIRNQFGRRNLPPAVRVELALRLEEEVAARAKERMMAGKNPPQNSAEGQTRGETREEIARLAGVSRDTVAKVKKVREAAEKSPAAKQIRDKMRRGEVSVNKAARQVRKQTPTQPKLSKKEQPSEDPKPETSAKVMARFRRHHEMAIGIVKDASVEVRQMAVEALRIAAGDLAHE